MINLPPAAIMLLGAVLILLFPRHARSAVFLVFPLLTFFYLLQLNSGDSQSLGFLNFNLTISRVDSLSLCFGYVFVLITFLGGVYGYHVKDTGEQASSLIYAGSSLGVVFAGDLITLFFFWEIMAVSSVYLIWATRTPLSKGAGLRYLMVHLFGGAMLLAGILLHLTQTSSIVFDHMEPGPASYLILFGFCLNAAVPPLHAWLPDAYPEGTVTGSVFLSAFTTKTAVYALARGFAGWELLIWAGLIMAIYGVIYAVLENDIRRLLAYHIVSQVGYMVCAVGIGTYIAIDGATAHAFSHILYKALLFMGAGTVLYATGTSKLSELGGLAKVMPAVVVLYMIGAFSISGVPLFSGFVSKSMVMYAAGLSDLGMVVLLLNLASVGTFLHTGLKLPYFTWFGRSHMQIKIKPVPPGMYIGMALTALCCIIIGVYPSLLYNILPFPTDYKPYTASHISETIQLLVSTGIGFWLLIPWLGGKNLISLDFDWFYRRPAKLAYTVFVASVSHLFDLVEHATIWLVQKVTVWSTNPVGYLLESMGQPLAFRKGKRLPDYDPDRYRISVGNMLLATLLLFIILLLWSLLNQSPTFSSFKNLIYVAKGIF